ncbi:MAG: hypothetical protein RIR62_1506 [Pseudomonadota bacterium]
MALRSLLIPVLALWPTLAAATEARPLPMKVPVAPPAGAAALCRTLPFACAGGQGAAVPATVMAEIARINRAANRIPALTDQAQYGRAEVWALPTARGGDCEDIVLLKKRALLRAGIAPDRLLIATVLDPNRAGHAVLILRAEAGDLVLDNLTDAILRWDRTGYAFLRVQDPAAPDRWVTSFAGGFLG